MLRNAATDEIFDGVIWRNCRFDREALARLNAVIRPCIILGRDVQGPRNALAGALPGIPRQSAAKFSEKWGVR